MHKGAMTGTVDTPVNIQVSDGQKCQSGEDAVCGFKKADIYYDTKQPINGSVVNRKRINLMNGKL